MANEMAHDKPKKIYKIMINRSPYDWEDQFITGSQIKEKAGSPADYVVNMIVEGPGDDPEIANDQKVDLSTPGRDKFLTRKPTTTPGV